jgi:hypothetical protein
VRAGHRHSLGLTDSGYVTSRGISTGGKNIKKGRSFAYWSGGSSGDDSAADPSAAPAERTISEETMNPFLSLLRD